MLVLRARVRGIEDCNEHLRSRRTNVLEMMNKVHSTTILKSAIF
jgi:hypothetical protein